MKVGVTHSFHHAAPYDRQQHKMNKIGDKIRPTPPPKPLPLLRLQIAKRNNYQNKSLQNHAQQNPGLHSKRYCMPPESGNIQAMQIRVMAVDRIVDVISGHFPEIPIFPLILELRQIAEIEIGTRI
jgi:hypothetical protein